MTKEELLKEANKAREKSYSPYSHFSVGACILCKDGRFFHGANIENASYPLSMCAERNAIYHALMEGYHKEDFAALAIIGETDEPISPCGACRQVIQELFPKDMPIYLGNLKGDIRTTNAVELLPFTFDSEDLQ